VATCRISDTTRAMSSTPSGSYFKELPPARVTVQAAKLPRDALIEIDAITMQ
jgi:enamine deaminase RidA (YjgF/YER057c/UK114 family)